jgi:MarR family transcriptional regulator, organic hydroperoxide resistance regulator
MVKKTQGGFLTTQIKQIQDRIFNRLIKENGIEEFNGPHGRILYVLWQEDNLPIGELALKTSLAKTSITSMLDRMEEKGQIQRVYDRNDRRQTRVVLSEKAKMLSLSYQEVSQKMSEIFYKGFSDEEIQLFENALERILNNLKNIE